MKIHELFLADVTRDIPPVVYFHEQSPKKLADEVSEYIITGGWPADHPNHRRVPDGIHEQYVRLLKNISSELAKPGGPELPTVWISGFYGSGKSSFAKLLGLALDGVALPDGTSLSEAWLKRDTAPQSNELRDAWHALRQKIDQPIAVVFDIGGFARDNEQIHSAALRQVQRRLGYCSTDPLVADFELKLERDGKWPQFEKTAQQTLGKPWAEVRDKALAEEDFSQVMSVMFPERYTDPMAWITSRAGTHQRSESPEEAVAAIRDMLKFRRPNATLFVVVDEVSQYVLADRDRVDRLRAFASALGATLKGRVWLFALGQQKIDEEADESFLTWAKDRFPPKLRVHLAATNIRDVIHKRLLQKTPAAEAQLRTMFEKHRPDLKLFAYACDAITAEDFVETYPMLPGQIDLLLLLTSALRLRSARAQGDDQAIRGLLQLLGELFRSQDLANKDVGDLITLNQIYEIQHTALGSDVQASMARILNECAHDSSGLRTRVAKAVALLELIQETTPTDAKLVAQCLYDRLDRGSQVSEVTDALEDLRRLNLLGYSEKLGYKIQSSAGEEWERDRREISVGRAKISEIVQDALKLLMASPEKPKLKTRPFPWSAFFSDGREADDVALLDPRDEAAVRIDFRYLTSDERSESAWTKRSGEKFFEHRIVWVCADIDPVETAVREMAKSQEMVRIFTPRQGSLGPARQQLLIQERSREDELRRSVQEAVAATWMAGKFYFQSQMSVPSEYGASFSTAVTAVATRRLPDLFPHFQPLQITPSELLQLLEPEIIGPSPKFLVDQLGILELDGGKFVAGCAGVIPQRILNEIEQSGGVSGGMLISHFGGPPFGYTSDVIKACVAGLLRASKVRIQPENETEITAPRDAGSRDVFEKDRSFRRADLFPAGSDEIGFADRAKICQFFEQHLSKSVEREPNAIADAVVELFPKQADRLKDVLARLNRLPDASPTPAALTKLSNAIEQCVRSSRQTKPTVKLVKRHLDTLRDGVQLVNAFASELKDEALEAVREVADLRDHQIQQLQELQLLTTETAASAERITAQLKLERPWREIRSLDDDARAIREAYIAERKRMLQWQEQQAEQARGRLKCRPGFSTLTADQTHRVLRPLQQATTATTADAIAPVLSFLKDPFAMALRRAEEEANETLDNILSEGAKPMIKKIDLALHNRELATEADVDALLAQINAGRRIRLQ